LAVGDQPVGDVLADPGAALDRPDPLRPPAGVGQQGGEPLSIGGEPAATKNLLAGGHDLDRDRALVRVHPDHNPRLVLLHLLHVLLSLALGPSMGRAGRAPLRTAGHTPLEPLAALR
jgi:hypothetical protein